MKKESKVSTTAIIAALCYLSMIAVNAMANGIPINGVTTGAVSDSYRNLFAPTAITFSIWGVIYTLLALEVLHHLGLFSPAGENRASMDAIGKPFIVSSLANALWMFCWHYDLIGLSVILMLVIFFSLLAIFVTTKSMPRIGKAWFFIRLPFSIYFGWISIALVANIAVFLTKLEWNGFGIAESTWTVVILLVAAAIGVVTSLTARDIPYASVFLWAYVGILIKHVGKTGFNGAYPMIVTTLIVCITLLVLAIVAVPFFLARDRNKR